MQSLHTPADAPPIPIRGTAGDVKGENSQVTLKRLFFRRSPLIRPDAGVAIFPGKGGNLLMEA